MRFPPWVREAAKASQKESRRARLRFLIQHAAMHHNEGASVAMLADGAGVDRTLIYRYINRGAFPTSTALKLEGAVGRFVLQHEWLVNPQEVFAA